MCNWDTWGSVSVLKSTIILVWSSFLTQKYFFCAKLLLKVVILRHNLTNDCISNLNKILLHLICVSFFYEILVSSTVCHDNNKLHVDSLSSLPHYLRQSHQNNWWKTVDNNHVTWPLCMLVYYHGYAYLDLWSSRQYAIWNFSPDFPNYLQSCTHTLRGNCGCSHMLCTSGCFCFVC